MTAASSRLALAAMVVGLLLCRAAAALSPAPAGFDLARSTREANVIVRGHLSPGGGLTVAETFLGSPPGKHMNVKDGGRLYTVLNTKDPAQGPMEVVIFFQSDPTTGLAPVRGERGLVRLSGDGVYCGIGPVFDTDGLRFDRHDKLTRAVFLAEVARAVQAEKDRRALSPLKPGADRAKKVVAHLRALPPSLQTEHRFALAALLRPIVPAEEKVILDALPVAGNEELVTLLLLLRDIPCSPAAFDTLLPWLRPGRPGNVRLAAMCVLDRLDEWRLDGELAPLLTLNEPELHSVLCYVAAEPSHGLLNVKAADGLVRLARDMRQACLAKGYQEDYPGTPHLLQRAAGYWHPRLVPVLYEWGLADDHRTCDQALTYLQQITGLKYSREQAQDWLSWWRWAGPLVERRYDLADPAGVKAWLKAYVDADVAARRLLLRLWYFEPKVDEKALLIDSAGPHAAGARAALAELWLRGRLTAATRLALVQRFLRFELTELPPTPGNGPAWREVRIVARTDFSFPEDIWVHPRSAIALDGKPQLDDSWGSRQLGGDSHFGSLGSQRFGAPTARAVIEIREPRKDGGVAWIWRWEPKPLRLRDVGPEKPR